MAKRTLHDKYFRQAKREGYLARSAYKLIELDNRRKLIRKGDTVLDLGCAPGSWLQVASQRVGPRGRVIGIDLTPIGGAIAPNVRTVVGDFTETPPERLLDHKQDGSVKLVNTVISDMAPNTSGHGDHFISVRLCETILDAMPHLLRPGGSMTMKVFEGEAMGELLARTRSMFRDVKVVKPKATRDVSREVYITAKRFRPLIQDEREPSEDLSPDDQGNTDQQTESESNP